MTDIRPKKNKSIGSHQSMQVKIDMITIKIIETNLFRENNRRMIIIVKMYGFRVNSYHKTRSTHIVECLDI